MIVYTWQGRVVQAKNTAYQFKEVPRGGVRGSINGFSAASRRRLIDLFNRMDMRNVNTKFLTLTFSGLPSFENAKYALKRFIQKMRRKFNEVSGVWRMEIQSRGAIHFHLVLFGMGFWKQREIQETWQTCTGETTSIVDIRRVKNTRQLMSYVSKYLAKVQKDTGLTSLDEVAYQNTADLASTGRWWGYLNKKNLPFAPKRELVSHDHEMFAYFRWACAAISRGHARGTKHMIKLFSEDAGQMFGVVRGHDGLTWEEYDLCKAQSGHGRKGAADLENTFSNTTTPAALAARIRAYVKGLSAQQMRSTLDSRPRAATMKYRVVFDPHCCEVISIEPIS